MWCSVSGCWLLCSAAQANKAITMLVSPPVPAGETSQVKREREGERGRLEGRRKGGRDLKANTSLSSSPLNIYCLKKKGAAFSIFDVLLTST